MIISGDNELTGKPAICIIMATLLEAKPFIKNLKLKKTGQESFDQFADNNIHLIISSIGKTNAAVAATYCCREAHPDCVVNMGAAGATDHSHPVGAIFHIDRIIEYDRPRFFTGKPFVHKPDRLKGFSIASLASGDRPVIEPEDRKVVSAQASLVDMEAAAVVQTCKIFQTPCYVFKFVSDVPGHTHVTGILKNIRKYRGALFDFFMEEIVPKIKTGTS